MEIKQTPISELIPYANNARTHDDAQIARIAASINEFGFTNPVLIDGDSGIIVGHGRIMAARKLNMATVPCIELSHLTPTQKKAYIIADNKLALNSGWDEELLKLELIGLEDLGFDLDLTGFDAEELDELIGAGTKLKEHAVELKQKKFIRILLSVPIDSAIDAKDLIDQLADVDGIEIDYGAN